MGKLSIFIIVLFLAVISLFAINNQELTAVRIPFGPVYELPTIALILLSSVAGFLITLIVFAIRDAKRFIDNWQTQKKQKQELKIQDLYSKALNSLLAHNMEEAKDALEGILREDLSHVNALLRLGDIYDSEDDFQKANTYYQKARNANPKNFEALFSLEQLMEKTDRWSEALRYLDEVLDIDKDNLNALYRKRSILEKQGRWDDIVDLQKMILKYEHNEKDKQREELNLIGYQYEFGRVSLEQNNLEKARKIFKTILRSDKDFLPATLGLAEVMLRESTVEEAVNLLERTFESSSSKIILARLEDLLINLNEPGRLISIYKSSISRNPADQTIKFFLGKLYYRLEMVDDALEVLTGIDATSQFYPDLNLLLGNLYMRRNQPEQAVNEFKKVVDIKKSLRLPYCCINCGHSSEEWEGRCSSCGEWSTYHFTIDGSCRPHSQHHEKNLSS